MTLPELIEQRNAAVDMALQILANYLSVGYLTSDEIRRIMLLAEEADELNGRIRAFDGTIRETTDAAGPTEFRDAE